MTDKVARDIEAMRQMQEQGVSSNELHGLPGDELRAERGETTERLIQQGKMSGAAKTPESFRDYLHAVLTAQVALLSNSEVMERARYYALTDPMACAMFERTFGPLH